MPADRPEHDGAATTVGILLYDGVDLLDAGGPYEVFLTASRLVARDGGRPPFEVLTTTADGAPVTAMGGLGLVPHTSVAELSADLLVVPGAVDLDRARRDPAVTAAMSALRDVPVHASVCVGAFLLADAGILTDQPWTTHWEDHDELRQLLGTPGRPGWRWVDAGPVVSAGGLACGLDMALHLVDRIEGRELAERTARQLDHPWDGHPRHGAAEPSPR